MAALSSTSGAAPLVLDVLLCLAQPAHDFRGPDKVSTFAID
jgi:hypothetical protein